MTLVTALSPTALLKNPYRITYQYPGEAEETAAAPGYRRAETIAGEHAADGAHVTVYYQRPDETRTILSRFGPGIEHTVTHNGDTWSCTCGAWDALTDFVAHRENAGLCWACGSPQCENNEEVECPTEDATDGISS